MEIRCLNTLRGLAALIVVVSHFSNASGLWGKFLGDGAGLLGVMLFFLLSGFLMAYLYWEKKPTPHTLISYATSRAARVLPLYFIIVILSFATPFLYEIKDVGSLVSHMLFLHGNSVLWTIPPEIQFYVLFSLAWLLSSYYRKVITILIPITFITALLLNYQNETAYFLGLTLSPTIIKAIPFFILGCVFGAGYRHRKTLCRYQSHWYSLTLLLIPALYPQIFESLFGYKHGMWNDFSTLATVGFVFFSIVYLVPDNNHFLENKIGDFFGRISYSLYLLHLPVLWFLTDMGWMKFGALSLLLFIVSASFVAWLVYNLFEAPSRKAIRSRFAGNKKIAPSDISTTVRAGAPKRT